MKQVQRAAEVEGYFSRGCAGCVQYSQLVSARYVLRVMK